LTMGGEKEKRCLKAEEGSGMRDVDDRDKKA
jgi:hypothetical protein